MKPADDVTIAEETPDQPEVRAFLAAADAYAESLYPPASNHLLDIGQLRQPAIRFLVARRDGRAVGCGAVRIADGYGEVKRMWVAPEARGLRIGALLLERIEALAIASGLGVLRLETGIQNREALALYRRTGFVEIAAFGGYRPDPLSVFMEKTLPRP